VQERARRGGTVSVANVVGFGAACRAALRDQAARCVAWERLRESLEGGLRQMGGRIVGAEVPRIPNTTCVVFQGVPGDLLVQGLDLEGIAVSTGAACASGSLERSPTLTAMGDAGAGHALRLSLGPSSTAEEVAALLTALRRLVLTGSAH
jgi:cysteine desulfurase